MTNVSVTESKAGTMTDDKGQAKVSPLTEVKTPDDASKVSSEEPPKVYTQIEHDAALREATKKAAESEAGREKKKSEAAISTLNEQMTDITAERDKVQAEIEELTKDDPAKFNLITKDKDLRERERLLKVGIAAENARVEANSETIKLSQETLTEIAIWEIATEFQGGDPVKLKDLCASFEATTEESIRKVAEAIWAKAPKTEPAKLKLYSGLTDGGAEDLSGLSPRQKIQKGLEIKANKT